MLPLARKQFYKRYDASNKLNQSCNTEGNKAATGAVEQQQAAVAVPEENRHLLSKVAGMKFRLQMSERGAKQLAKEQPKGGPLCLPALPAAMP